MPLESVIVSASKLSISNLLAKGCGSAAANITDGDLAYLRALYKLPVAIS